MTDDARRDPADLIEGARQFLVGGGRVTWAEWADMRDDTRAAFVIAGERLERDRAAMIVETAASSWAASEGDRAAEVVISAAATAIMERGIT